MNPLHDRSLVQLFAMSCGPSFGFSSKIAPRAPRDATSGDSTLITKLGGFASHFFVRTAMAKTDQAAADAPMIQGYAATALRKSGAALNKPVLGYFGAVI
jgi:hypothetical protein